MPTGEATRLGFTFTLGQLSVLERAIDYYYAQVIPDTEEAEITLRLLESVRHRRQFSEAYHAR